MAVLPTRAPRSWLTLLIVPAVILGPSVALLLPAAMAFHKLALVALVFAVPMNVIGIPVGCLILVFSRRHPGRDATRDALIAAAVGALTGIVLACPFWLLVWHPLFD